MYLLYLQIPKNAPMINFMLVTLGHVPRGNWQSALSHGTLGSFDPRHAGMFHIQPTTHCGLKGNGLVGMVA